MLKAGNAMGKCRAKVPGFMLGNVNAGEEVDRYIAECLPNTLKSTKV